MGAYPDEIGLILDYYIDHPDAFIDRDAPHISEMTSELVSPQGRMGGIAGK